MPGAMASPLRSGKRSVNLATPVRASRIRRDPPPAVKEVPVPDQDERDERTVVIGVVTFAVALFVIMIGFSSAEGWSPSEYTINIKD